MVVELNEAHPHSREQMFFERDVCNNRLAHKHGLKTRITCRNIVISFLSFALRC